MNARADLRPSPIAGTWYSSNPARLGAEIDRYLAAAQATMPPLEGQVIAVITPHAGHRYSGRTAGYAFRSVQGCSPRVVAVLSPYHEYHPAMLLTSAHAYYATPLGNLAVDRSALQRIDDSLKSHNLPRLYAIANDREHSLEIELPFLQRALKDPFELLPLMVRARSPEILRLLGESLAEILAQQESLLVASTDLSHFFPLETACKLDEFMLGQIEAFSPEGVLEAEARGTGFACGAPAVAATLWAARALGGNRVVVLHHSTSADETGDPSSVVGYGAAVVLKSA
ncbi:MAG TPA: AmmeMemoRadiSam system protein B [Anaerolineaceae bacterium]|nr:AmmeMemoRadiSam system protein B [Anaerolineaceae bacterium]